jgi:hypothetical protein
MHDVTDATACEKLASSPYDNLRRTPGIWSSAMHVDDAIHACESLHDGRSSFLLGRALEMKGRSEDAVKALSFSALEGYAVSWRNLGYIAGEANLESLADKLYYVYFQRMVIDTFPILYPRLSSMRLDQCHQIPSGNSLSWHLSLARLKRTSP